MLLISLIGTLVAVNAGGLLIEESENYLFSPFMIKWLREEQCKDVILKILEKGCELEDIESLIS